MSSPGCIPHGRKGPLVIREQGSFFIGGRTVKARGIFDATISSRPPGDGQTFWVDQMYVQYQIPNDACRLPLVLVHGGGGTGRVWESTPDGREGYQSIFLRLGHPVYIVDAPRGGRSGFPSFTGPFGVLDSETRLVAETTYRPGLDHGWARWRLGPDLPSVYPEQAFPIQAVDSFFKHLRPLVSDDPNVIATSLVELLDRIGPAVLVTHSNSGLWGWLAGGRSADVAAIVSYEPGVVFPENGMPSPVPLYRGVQAAGDPVGDATFSRLAEIPIQIVYGDNIPTAPVANLVADSRRAQVIASHLFTDALNARGGCAEVLHLPDVGLRGNSHFMFSDLNNLEVADQLSLFLKRYSCDGRWQRGSIGSAC